MTRTPHRLLLAALLAASGTVALAQMPPGAGMGGRGGPGVMQQRMHALRMADLKAALNITAAQEGAWTTFAAAMQPPGPSPRAQVSGPEYDNLTTPERMELMEKRRAERIGQSVRRVQAIKTFYAQLTPEQQKVFDTWMSQTGPGNRGGQGQGQGQGMGRWR